MSVRNYANYLLLSGLLSEVPTVDNVLKRFSDYVMKPRAKVVEADCGTQMGSVEEVGSSLVGKVELSTDLTIDLARVLELQGQGLKEVSIRTVNTCTSNKGICQACFAASNPLDPLPGLNEQVIIDIGNTQPFFSYLANSYSGSLVGIQALPEGRLPLRKGLFDYAITDQHLTIAMARLRTFRDVPADLLEYAGIVEDKLERALLIVVLYSLYSST